MSVLDDDEIIAVDTTAGTVTASGVRAWLPEPMVEPYFCTDRSRAGEALDRLQMYVTPSTDAWKPFPRRTRRRARIVLS